MIKNYLKVALKVLLRKKFFTFISLFGISFTLAVLMASAAFVDHYTAPHAPESRLDRTLYAHFVELQGERAHVFAYQSWYMIEKYFKHLKTPEMVSVYKRCEDLPTFVGNRKLMLSVKYTDANFWAMRNFNFLEGHAFTKADFDSGTPVTVISERTRDEYFGHADVIGKRLEVDGIGFRVIGVVKNIPMTQVDAHADVWAPITASHFDRKAVRFFGSFMVSILAKSKADFPLIRDEWHGILSRVDLSPSKYSFTDVRIPLMTRTQYISSSLKMALGWTEHYEESTGSLFYLILFGGMLLFMLLPTINLVNINLSRILERSSEIGVRKAFGASRQFLVGQFITENIVLTLIGGALGLLFSFLLLKWIEMSGLVADADFSLNFRVFGASLVICLFFGIFSGVYPAWRMSRLHPVDALRGGMS